MDHARDVAVARAAELVRALHALVLPVGPVDVLLEERQREDVRQPALDHVVPVGAGERRDGDVVEPRVRPEEQVGDVVDRERVRPADVVVDDRPPLAAVHADAADVRVVAPVGVEEPAAVRVDGDRARLLQAAVDQHEPVAAVERRHLDRVGRLVAPVDVAAEPVDRQPVRVVDRRVVQRLRHRGARHASRPVRNSSDCFDLIIFCFIYKTHRIRHNSQARYQNEQ